MTMFDLIDDFGYWAVVPKIGGRWAVRSQAESEALLRNFEGGVTDDSGRLLTSPTRTQLERFEQVHLRHRECTCTKFTSKASVDRQLEDADTSTPNSGWLGRYRDRHAIRKGARPANQGAS
jgi:hypothetical protein